MDREYAKKVAPIIQAFAEGKTVQWLDKMSTDTPVWRDIDDPNWNPSFEYRVKPETKTYWMNIYKNQGGDLITGYIHPSEQIAKDNVETCNFKYAKTISFEMEE
ncbi:MAG TPA: hypothetical protein VFM18_02420 [Methanosarcina sp.]|nr:hypothetical protein [Methanosarcina sp.]